MSYIAMFRGRASRQHLDTVRRALQKLAHDAVHEPRTLQYEFYQEEDDPAVFILFAAWESEADWRAHVAADAHQEYVASLPDGAWESAPVQTRLTSLKET